eukprot:COSAG01_NODE_20584_length_946_cov_7.059330_1_plen_263_part_10
MRASLLGRSGAQQPRHRQTGRYPALCSQIPRTNPLEPRRQQARGMGGTVGQNCGRPPNTAKHPISQASCCQWSEEGERGGREARGQCPPPLPDILPGRAVDWSGSSGDESDNDTSGRSVQAPLHFSSPLAQLFTQRTLLASLDLRQPPPPLPAAAAVANIWQPAPLGSGPPQPAAAPWVGGPPAVVSGGPSDATAPAAVAPPPRRSGLADETAIVAVEQQTSPAPPTPPSPPPPHTTPGGAGMMAGSAAVSSSLPTSALLLGA